MKRSEKAALDSDPIRFSESLLMAMLFPSTEEEARARLHEGSYPIVSTLVDRLKRDRERIRQFLEALDRGASTEKEISELRLSLVIPPVNPEKCYSCGKELGDETPTGVSDFSFGTCIVCGKK